MISLLGLLRPHRQLIAIGVLKVKSPAAGKLIDSLNDLATGLGDFIQGLIEVSDIEDKQYTRRSGLDTALPIEATVDAGLGKADVIRPPVGEFPAEYLFVELLGFRLFKQGQFDVIDGVVDI